MLLLPRRAFPAQVFPSPLSHRGQFSARSCRGERGGGRRCALTLRWKPSVSCSHGRARILALVYTPSTPSCVERFGVLRSQTVSKQLALWRDVRFCLLVNPNWASRGEAKASADGAVCIRGSLQNEKVGITSSTRVSSSPSLPPVYPPTQLLSPPSPPYHPAIPAVPVPVLFFTTFLSPTVRNSLLSSSSSSPLSFLKRIALGLGSALREGGGA